MSSASDLTKPHGPAEFEQALPQADAQVVAFDDEHRGLLRAAHQALHDTPTIVPLLVLAAAIALFSAIVGARFFHPFNLSLILQQVTIIAIVGSAQTLVILTAGVDLSVGAIMVLSSVVMGRLAVMDGVPVALAFPIGMAVGTACGFINGVLVTKIKLPPFIVTLGTWSIFGALNLLYSHNETIRQQEVEAAAPFLQWLGTAFKLWGARLTYGSVLMILIAALLWYVLQQTAYGRHVYATGNDPDAARLAGVKTDRTLISVYTLAGLICAIASWAVIGRIGAISALSGGTANLDSITAVVIGGTSLFGGRGSIIGTLIGALIVGVFRNGLALGGADALWQEFAVGVLIILAVAIDQWIRKVGA
jgi:fructose transport system permease protein